MLRVTTLYASSAGATANYYTQYLTKAPGEIAGVWAGRQAAGLGLAGEVAGEGLQSLLEGRDPIGGSPLGNALVDRTFADGRVVRAVSGFDATFSAPKSLSVLWALTQDTRLLEAHDAAVTATLEHLEQFGSTTRIRSNGRRLHPDSQGLTMAVFRQTTSRLDDPQVHTHTVISAKVQTADGRWLALDARYLKRHQRMLGGVYQSTLRSELTARFGLGWGEITSGQAKLTEFQAREGRQPTRWERGALTREASADTRGHKSGNGVTELVTRWRSEAAAHGWNGVQLVDQVTETGRREIEIPVPEVAVDEVIEALSTAGSTWSRADVLRTVCDLQRPIPGMTADAWHDHLEQMCDAVLAECIDLDPTNATMRRESDARSGWLEPISPHVTSGRVVAEEESVLAWALEAQTPEPRPSATVDVAGLDVLQADLAAAVAGHDRLVLGNAAAGTGKTTSIRTAVTNLTAQGRVGFGVAPSAKAARVLERETGLPADTLAKLLHEWRRSDRPPGDRYRLGAGATVIVDEAGMVGTAQLAELVALADRNNWRLVLVGDNHQLQAVGRGGLFQELCTRGRTHHLEHIHRFHAPWEGAASLGLRHGDPRILDTYLDHGRIVADTFDAHIEHITQLWLDTTDTGQTIAITTATNDHVDAINAAIQTARIEHGQLDGNVSRPIGGGERAHVGDVIVTRRNNRDLNTTNGDPVRNRETWTVTDLAANGDMTVSSDTGAGDVTLPPEYVTEHVRLGYAATEHGNQGDTVDIGIELATSATTRRGLYVGATRGRDTNLILVTTDPNDLDLARDTLEAILVVDRVDIPATTQRRTLAHVERGPASPQPRAEVPPWFKELVQRVHAELASAEIAHAERRTRWAGVQGRVADAEQRLAQTALDLERHTPALADAAAQLAQARSEWRDANTALIRASRRHRGPLGREVAVTRAAIDAAFDQQRAAEHRARPAQDAHRAALDELTVAKTMESGTRTLLQLPGREGRVAELRSLAGALDAWQRWADGYPLNGHEVTRASQHLRRSPWIRDRSTQIQLHELARQLPRPPMTRPDPASANRSRGLER
jgi:conjugative relaxase-like TrwC/TraI family protein